MDMWTRIFTEILNVCLNVLGGECTEKLYVTKLAWSILANVSIIVEEEKSSVFLIASVPLSVGKHSLNLNY